jgi:hypothetical protein
MIIQSVHPDLVPQLMPVVSEFIASGLAHTDSCTLEHAQVYLANGTWTLLVASENEKITGAYVLSFYNEPTDRIALIVSAAGGGLASQDAADQVFNIARARGATKMQVLARESAARLYKRVGLVEKAALMEIKL